MGDRRRRGVLALVAGSARVRSWRAGAGAEENAAAAAYSLRVSRRRHPAPLAASTGRRSDQAIRDRLILTYAPLVKYVAGRLGSGLPAHVDEGDLVSYGLLGLIGAIERYDPDRDVKFETYAIARIKGAIIDELRAMDWVPRSVRARAREIERAIAELEAKLAPRADRRGDRREARHHGRGARGQPHRDLALLDRRARRALDGLGSSGDQIALIDTIEDTDGPEPQAALDADRAAGGDRRGDRAACPSARSSSSRSTTTRS